MKQEDYCPICGIDVREIGYMNHRCNKRTLSAIDAAHTRFANEDSNIIFPQPSLAERLEMGFNMAQGKDPWSREREEK